MGFLKIVLVVFPRSSVYPSGLTVCSSLVLCLSVCVLVFSVFFLAVCTAFEVSQISRTEIRTVHIFMFSRLQPKGDLSPYDRRINFELFLHMLMYPYLGNERGAST